MEVRNWPVDQIMQLPDYAFGRRFVVSCTVQGADGAANWDISELALPEKFVVWEFQLYAQGTGTDMAGIRVALGDQLPAAIAEMDLLQPVIHGFGVQGIEPRTIFYGWMAPFHIVNMRVPFEAAGRRLIIEVTGAAGKTPWVAVYIVVSSFPREVTEWMISGRR